MRTRISPETSASSVPSDAERYPNWWLFCLIILSVKLLLLAVDPLPKLFLGDSGSYLWTSLTGWIPADRSFFYGFIIRWTSRYSASLTSLLLAQVAFSTLTAIFVAWICRRFFRLSPVVSYVFGFFCAIDPMQLIWERYVLTETISLFFYAGMLVSSFSYLRQRRLWQLILIQVIGLILVSLRISYLLVLEASTVLLPLLAFYLPLHHPSSPAQSRSFPRRLRGTVLHLLVSLALFFGLHYGYKRLNGYLSGRPPAYLYASGFSLLAAWAPLLKPEDSPDQRLARIISEGDQFQLRDMRHRNNQLYSDDSLMSRWKKVEPDLAIADKVANQTALHCLLHRPFGVMGLGLRTFVSYFDLKQIYGQGKSDLGRADWPDTMARTMALRFRLAAPSSADAKSFTTLQKYFLKAQPYWYLVLLSPVLGLTLLFFVRSAYLILLFVHAGIFLATDCLFTVTASVRYLQPMSLVTILFLALALKAFLDRKSLQAQPAPTI